MLVWCGHTTIPPFVHCLVTSCLFQSPSYFSVPFLSMDYSFIEELTSYPDQALSSQIADWTVAWKGRQQVSTTAVGPIFSPFPDRVIALMQKYRLESLKIQVFNSPTDSFGKGFLRAQAPFDLVQPFGSAAGLSITASLAIPTSALLSKSRHSLESFLIDAFRGILLEIFAQRWILGSLESIRNRRLHRFLHVDWDTMQQDGKESVNVPVLLWLPHEAASFSAEGLTSFLSTFIPCSGVAGMNSPTAWSNLLLGHEGVLRNKRQIAASTVDAVGISGRKGLWVEIQGNGNTDCLAQNCSYLMDTGMLWRIRTKGEVISWANLLGNDGVAATPTCLVVDSFDLQLLENAAISVEEKCNSSAKDLSSSIKQECIRVSHPAVTTKRASMGDHEFFSVESNLLRTHGPGHGGRFETTVRNQHPSCNANIRILQVIPPVLKPKWSSFAVENSTLRPRREWKEDGTLILTLNTTLSAQSLIQYGFEYDPAFLSIETFPADPNRGFEFPPVRVIVHPLCIGEDGLPQRLSIFSESMLFLSPLPDASMPFNVLSLSCTLFAFVVGSILNLLVRRASEKIKYKLQPELKPKNPLEKIKDRVNEKVQAIGAKFFPKKEPSEVELEKKKKQ